MLYMKEMRANVVAECTLKESAAINQILGRRVGTPISLSLTLKLIFVDFEVNHQEITVEATALKRLYGLTSQPQLVLKK